ncbi:MAG: hypothetical protein QOH96_1682 [Blastocatellia bacterium]|jgi:hypothetical protein|nr:hypothetical protein [Blastocatellia bacterium]
MQGRKVPYFAQLRSLVGCCPSKAQLLPIPVLPIESASSTTLAQATRALELHHKPIPLTFKES